MQKDSDSPEVTIVHSSIKDVLNRFGDKPDDPGLTIAIQDNNLVIGFHKDYIVLETGIAIAFEVNMTTFMDLLSGVQLRNVQ